MRANWSDLKFAQQVSDQMRQRNLEQWADPAYAQKVADAARVRKTIHGLWKDPLYQVHVGMMNRCYRPTSKGFHNYGARGIRVYGPWHDPRVGIPALNAALGARPNRCTLDRIDNDGHYAPGNLRWATASEQTLNQGHGPVVPLDETCMLDGCICTS